MPITAQHKILFIINPVSGPVHHRMTAEKLHALLLQAEVSGDIEQTSYAGHAPKLALAASEKGYDTVVAVGGDGTVNEISGALSGTNVKLGIIPRGSGNGLARHLHIPMDPLEALGVIKANSALCIDSGTINGKPFFCTAGIGFDGYISGVFAASKKRGLATYAQLVISNFFTYKPAEAKIKADGDQIAAPVYVLAFANASQYGNNAYIAPMANVADGALDMCLIRNLNFASALEVGYSMMNKTLATSAHAEYKKVRTVQVKTEVPCAFHTDGEYAGNADTFEISIKPGILYVLKPENFHEKE